MPSEKLRALPKNEISHNRVITLSPYNILIFYCNVWVKLNVADVDPQSVTYEALAKVFFCGSTSSPRAEKLNIQPKPVHPEPVEG